MARLYAGARSGFAATDMRVLAQVGWGSREVRFGWLGGQPVITLWGGEGSKIVDGATARPVVMEGSRIIAAARAAMPGAKLIGVKKLERPDRYWYSTADPRNDSSPLPVLREVRRSTAKLASCRSCDWRDAGTDGIGRAQQSLAVQRAAQPGLSLDARVAAATLYPHLDIVRCGAGHIDQRCGDWFAALTARLEGSISGGGASIPAAAISNTSAPSLCTEVIGYRRSSPQNQFVGTRYRLDISHICMI